MTGPTTILQDPIAIAILVTAVTWTLATWTSHRDADALEQAGFDGFSRAQGAVIVGLAALWLWLRNRRRIAETPDHQIIEHRDGD